MAAKTRNELCDEWQERRKKAKETERNLKLFLDMLCEREQRIAELEAELANKYAPKEKV